MGNYYDIGYFKNKKISRSVISKKRSILNKINAWDLDEKYYDGKREDGYGGYKYDGRWKKFIPKIFKKYKLKNNSRFLDLGCKKGFLLKDLNTLYPNVSSFGIENHKYPIHQAKLNSKKSRILLSEYYKIPFKDKYFDFTIAFNAIYMYNLKDVIMTLKEIDRVSKKSYVIVASGEDDKERNLFYRWTLIGTTILLKNEWRKLFKKIGFTGDYYFSSAKSLGL
jgi:SAM-dependent methyltransferase